MKLLFALLMMLKIVVAPLAGAWIEIICAACHAVYDAVAPLAGAWIEIASFLAFSVAAL